MESKYIHETNVHNLKDPKIIVKEILKHFSPKTVIDLGCGLGTFVKVFQDYGVDAYGVNGEWTERGKLFMNEDALIIHNLEKYRDFGKKYDMAISLEVAEHIDEKYSDNFIKTIISCADIIIFSAAVPGQIGQNHVNLQSPEYREKKFSKYGYKFYDVFRHLFWDNEQIFWRYKQNIFLVAKNGVKIPSSLIEKGPRFIIHPKLYNLKNIDNYSILYLIKFIINKIYKRIKFNLFR